MRNTGYVLLFIVAFTLIMSLPVLADPFSDVPQDHWAYDAVQMLEEKGLVEGYPDGLFKGDRAMTRYEMAMVVARVIAKLEQVQASIPEIPDLSIYATKQDLETINKLLDEFRNELDALGVRVNNIEDSLGKLTARVEELERVKISGTFQSIAADVGMKENPENINNGGPGSIYGANPSRDQYDTDPGLVSGTVRGDIDRFAGATLIYGTQNSGYFAPNGSRASMFGTGNASFPTYTGNGGYATTGGEPNLIPTSSTVNPYVQSATAGNPEFALNDGFAVASKLALTVTAKISDNVKAGGDLVAYSAFGDYQVYNNWGMAPQYNTLAPISTGGPSNTLDFQADLATLWFDADGDWDITGKFGNYNLTNVSHNLFYGVRNPYFGFHDTDVVALNGFDFAGRLYETVDVEVFYAQDINWVANGQSGVWFMQDPLDTTLIASPTHYRNYLQGIWAGYDGMENRLHVEGGIMRLYEDAASNAGQYLTNSLLPVGTGVYGDMNRACQDQLMYGFKAHYDFDGNWLRIYGEFNHTDYKASLQDNFARQGGNLFQIGAKAKVLDDKMDFYGEYVRTDANYDPFGYHQTWEREYEDGLHEGWDDMTGFGYAVRPGKFRPNRHGLDIGVTYKLAAGEIYGKFTYLQQVIPTASTAGDDDFNFYEQEFYTNPYGPITGRPALTWSEAVTNGYNFYGNQDYFFMYNSPNKGSEYMLKIGGKYDFGGNLHVFGGWDYLKFKRDYTVPTVVGDVYDNGRTDTNGYLPGQIGYSAANWANTDFSANFVHLGVTYDVTEKFGVQGNFAYVKNSGVDDSGFNQDNSTVIPGVALKYQFNDTTSIVMDYKYYHFTDSRVMANDYDSNKIITRLNVKF